METSNTTKKNYFDSLDNLDGCFDNPPGRKLDIRVIAILGLIPTTACTLLATPMGSKLFHEHGLCLTDAEFLSMGYAVLALMAFFCHALLYMWYMFSRHNENFFNICISLMLAYLASSLCVAILISALAANSNYLYFAVTNIVLWIAYSGVLLFFVSIVYSQKYELERISSDNLFARLSNQLMGH